MLTVLGIAVVTIVGALIVTLLTGFPGPGPLQRHPAADLNRLADSVNSKAESATYKPCYGTEDIATVDLVASRVVISRDLAFALDPDDVKKVDVPNGRPEFVAFGCDTG